MKLTEAQMEQFRDEGFIFIPEAFTTEEVALMRDAAVEIFRNPREQVWMEKSGAPRTAFAPIEPVADDALARMAERMPLAAE